MTPVHIGDGHLIYSFWCYSFPETPSQTHPKTFYQISHRPRPSQVDAKLTIVSLFQVFTNTNQDPSGGVFTASCLRCPSALPPTFCTSAVHVSCLWFIFRCSWHLSPILNRITQMIRILPIWCLYSLNVSSTITGFVICVVRSYVTVLPSTYDGLWP